METIVGGDIYYPVGREKEGEYPWGNTPSEERYEEVSRIPGGRFLSPYEMFGILAMENRRYIRDRSNEMISERAGSISQAKCIFVLNII